MFCLKKKSSNKIISEKRWKQNNRNKDKSKNKNNNKNITRKRATIRTRTKYFSLISNKKM